MKKPNVAQYRGCYKCGSMYMLSKKTTYLYICRPCRREAYKVWDKPIHVWDKMDDWCIKAYLRVEELSDKYQTKPTI